MAGTMSRLGKSKMSKAVLLAAVMAISSGEFFGKPSHAQEKQMQCERLKREFVPKAPCKTNKYKKIRVGPYIRPESFAQAGNFTGVKIKASPLNNRFYRHTEPVWSVPEYLLGIYKEAGYEVNDRNAFMEDMGNALGVCFREEYAKRGIKYRFAAPIYRRISPEVDVFLHAHEDWHAIQFLGCNECYSVLGKRLENHGYRIVFSDFDEEDQADVAGILALLDANLPLEPVFRRCKNTRNVYMKMQGYRIPQARFWEEDLSPVLAPAELYKPGRTNR